jgi:iron complex outermembrane recepter protein
VKAGVHGETVPSATFSNRSLTYRINSESTGQADVYLNIQNVFDKMPFPTASGGLQVGPGNLGGYAPGDDPVRRYYSVGVRLRM